jgi:hypothetical protein
MATDLSAAELLAVWEMGATQHPVQRALTLLVAAWPELPVTVFAQLSIGQRDACLLTVRERLFGPRLTGVARCAQCGERVELTFDVTDIRAPLPATDQGAEPPGSPAPALELIADEYRVRFRLPNSTDLLAIVDVTDPSAARQALLRRCILGVADDSGDVITQAPSEILAPLADVIGAAMDAADPQGNVQLALDCPACGHHWLQAFDILTYLWSEIDDWAQHILREVHLLASAYGWSEWEILALSARRRQSYLEMVLV